MNRKGYTLIELSISMVILVVISVFIMIAVLNSVRAVSLGNAANKVVSDLLLAQSLANASGQWYGVNFEASPVNRYTVYKTTGAVDSTIEDPGKKGAPLVVDPVTSFGVSISSVNISGGTKIEFSPLGTPYDDKTGSPISAEAIIVLSRDSASRSVRITPNTGRIYIQ